MAVSGEVSLCAHVPRLNMSFTRATIDRAIEAVRKLGYSRASDDQVVAIREVVFGRDVFVRLLHYKHASC